MWPFSRPAPPLSVAKQLAALEDRCNVLEGRLQNLALDLSDRYEKLYDRLSRVYARLTKREARDGDGAEAGDPRQSEIFPADHRAPPAPGSAHLSRRFKIGG